MNDRPTASAATIGERRLHLYVYTASGCSLCDDAHAALERLAPELGLTLEWRPIDGNTELEAQWRTQIPVGFLENRKVFKYIVDEPFLRRRVARMRDNTSR